MLAIIIIITKMFNFSINMRKDDIQNMLSP